MNDQLKQFVQKIIAILDHFSYDWLVFVEQVLQKINQLFN